MKTQDAYMDNFERKTKTFIGGEKLRKTSVVLLRLGLARHY